MLAAVDPDYRLIFWDEVYFRDRLEIIYPYRCTGEGPPDVLALMDEMWDVMIKVACRIWAETPEQDRKTTLDMKKVQEIIRTGDAEIAAPYLLEVGEKDFFEKFYMDLFLYLRFNGFNFYHHRLIGKRSSKHMYNRILTEVW